VQLTSADCIVIIGKPWPESWFLQAATPLRVPLEGIKIQNISSQTRPYWPGIPLGLWHRSRKAGVMTLGRDRCTFFIVVLSTQSDSDDSQPVRLGHGLLIMGVDGHPRSSTSIFRRITSTAVNLRLIKLALKYVF
jgi:hypothetical protein